MKKILSILLLCFLVGCSKVENTPITVEKQEPVTLNAIITSDLHFSVNPNVLDWITPLVSNGNELTQSIVNQVINEKPDVFIMTGDNTNSGDVEDVIALVDYLKQIKDAGIEVIVTTGNHDLNHMTSAMFYELYSPLFSIQEKDSNSNSYITILNDIAFFVMDDNTDSDGIGGNFSKETMQWLEEQLQTQVKENHFIIFLSHHNVIPISDLPNNYNISNKDLVSLLEKYNVLLCFTGHQHTQSLNKHNEMYELLSSTPLSSPHTLGYLTIQDYRVHYETKQIDFTSYGPDNFAEVVKEKDLQQIQTIKEQFMKDDYILPYSNTEKEEILNLLFSFFQYVQEGSIINHTEEIKENPYYEDLMKVVEGSNYEPWIKHLLDQPPLNSSSFEFSYE